MEEWYSFFFPSARTQTTTTCIRVADAIYIHRYLYLYIIYIFFFPFLSDIIITRAAQKKKDLGKCAETTSANANQRAHFTLWIAGWIWEGLPSICHRREREMAEDSKKGKKWVWKKYTYIIYYILPGRLCDMMCTRYTSLSFPFFHILLNFFHLGSWAAHRSRQWGRDENILLPAILSMRVWPHVVRTEEGASVWPEWAEWIHFQTLCLCMDIGYFLT